MSIQGGFFMDIILRLYNIGRGYNVERARMSFSLTEAHHC